MKKYFVVFLIMLTAVSGLIACDALKVDYDPDADKVNVTLDCRGGTAEETSVTVSYDRLFTLPVPTIEGNIFGGWYTGINGGGRQVTDASGAGTDVWFTTNDTTLYAYWGGSTGLYFSHETYRDYPGYYINGYYGSDSVIIVPDYYCGEIVVGINSLLGSWADRLNVTKIIIPQTIKYLDPYVFYDFVNLNSINLPDDIDYLSSEMFANTAIWNNAPNNSVVYVGNWAVGYKGVITNVTLKSETVGIASRAFSGSSLSSISISSTVRYIGSDAFNNTPLWDNFPYGEVVYADKWAVGINGYFNGTVDLRSDTVGIANNAFEFQYMSNLIIPRSIKYIGNRAFYYCYNLTGVEILRGLADGLTQTGENVFGNCINLSEIIVNTSADATAYRAAKNWSELAHLIKSR